MSCWGERRCFTRSKNVIWFKKGKPCFEGISFTRLGAKEELHTTVHVHLLVRLLMSHALSTIIHQIRHPRSLCHLWGRDHATWQWLSRCHENNIKPDFLVKYMCFEGIVSIWFCAKLISWKLMSWQDDLVRVDLVRIDWMHAWLN